MGYDNTISNGKETTEVIEVTRRCPWCGILHTVQVPTEGYNEWRRGEKTIQRALPDTSPRDRELLISGICDSCWDKMFD